MKIVIRAGGVGTRLWPYSRESRPKQLMPLVSNQSMLADTIDRVKGLVKKSDLYITTSERCAMAVKKEIAKYKIKNLIIEPVRKDTAAAIGLESVYIAKRDPKAIVASLGSDHYIRQPEEFRRILKVAISAVRKFPSFIFPIGVKPTIPDIGYGYIQLGHKLATVSNEDIYRVTRFAEKPKLELARKYLKAGNYLWNGNMFVWRVDTILSLFKIHLPKVYKQLMAIQAAIGGKNEQQVLKQIYPQIEKNNIDQAIIEKAQKVAAIQLKAGWSDIGGWDRLKDELTELQKDNLVHANHLGLGTEGCLIYGPRNKLIATIGIKNQVIVVTEDCILIADKARAPEVKELVEKIQKGKQKKYL